LTINVQNFELRQIGRIKKGSLDFTGLSTSPSIYLVQYTLLFMTICFVVFRATLTID